MKAVLTPHPAKPGGYTFKCPGCGETHLVTTAAPNGNGMVWGWNGSTTRPTFSPSLLYISGHYMPGYNSARCWCHYNAENPEQPAPFSCGVCHSFVRDGQIQFLNDCTHPLAGQTVDLPLVL